MEYNKDYKLRDSMLNKQLWCDGEGEGYDIFWFDKLTAATLEKLIDLGFADPEEYQNDSPTIGEILAFMKENPDFTAHGYAVTPDRSDYRISLEGVEGHTTDDKQVRAFVELFRKADDFTIKPNSQYAWYD